MSHHSSDVERDPIDRLAESFLARFRAGERPSVEEYAAKYPELAHEIRSLLPALVQLEENLAPESTAARPCVDSAGSETVSGRTPRHLGDYVILREVGRGGMGVVYEAEQVSLGRHVALKVLTQQLGQDTRTKLRFEREAKAAAKLHHTNIVPVFGVGEQDGMPYYVMQFIQGLGLDEVLEELKKLHLDQGHSGPAGGESPGSRTVVSAAQVARSLLSGQFHSQRGESCAETMTATSNARCQEDQGAVPTLAPAPSDSFRLSSTPVILPGQSGAGGRSRRGTPTYWQSVATIGMQVANALEYAHRRGIRHRDIKPSNLLLDTQGTVWVTDFGLAKADDQQNLTHTGDILGTLRYMPPEAFEGKTDSRSDVYSLGLTLYEMLAFRPAFDEKDRRRLIRQVTYDEPDRLGKLNRRIPRDLETIVHKSIEKDAKARYTSAGEFSEDLQRFIEDEPIKARRVSRTERLRRWCRRNPVIAALAAAVFLLLACVAVVASIGYAQTRLALNREANEHAESVRQGTEAARQRARAESNLYHSLVREAQAIRRLRDTGYRREVWDRLKQALALDTPDKDPAELRREAVACLGDFVGLEPTTWTDFAGKVEAVEIRPGARQLAVGLEDGTLLLRDLATGGEAARLREHSASVVSVTFDAKGRRMATGDLAGVVKVWQPRSGGGWLCTRTMAIDRPDPLPLESYKAPLLLALSPDGQSLFTWSSSHPVITQWDLTSGTRTYVFEAPASGKLSGPALSPDGKLMAAPYNRDRFLVWEVASRKLKHNIASDVGHIEDLAFSNDGHYLGYAGGQGGAVLVGPEFQRLSFAHFGNSASVRFSPDEELVAFSDVHRGVIRLWEVATNREIAVLKVPSMLVHSARFSEDGKTLLAWSYIPDAVQIWDLSAAREKLNVGGHKGGVPTVEFSPDGKLLASTSNDRTLRIWDPLSGRKVHEISGFAEMLEPLAFSPDGSILATGDYAGGIRFWQTTSWRELPAPKHPLGPQIWSVAFSPDGRHFAACGQKGIVLWRIVAGSGDGRLDSRLSFQQVARPSDQTVTSLSFSSDSRLLGWTPFDGVRLHLWDVSQSRPYPFLRLYINTFTKNMAFFRDGKHLAFVGGDGVPQVWNVRKRRQVYASGPDDFREARQYGLVGVVALSADDAWLAVRGARGSVTIWDMRRRELLLALPEEHGNNWSLAWSPDRTLLAAGFSDGSLVLWNIPRVRAKLAEIGLDWRDSPAPAPPAEPVEIGSETLPSDTTCLFELRVFSTTRATLAIDGNVCRVDVGAVDGTGWHAQISQPFEDAEEGARYMVRFRARADAPRRMFLSGGFVDRDVWHNFGLSQQVSLTGEWQDYQHEFQAKNLGTNNEFHFDLGDQTGTVWIAEFSVSSSVR
jgi:eukaryotic-like serine/threonine-protein kinase